MRRLLLCVVTAIVLVALATPAFAQEAHSWTHNGKMSSKTKTFYLNADSEAVEAVGGGMIHISVLAKKDVEFRFYLEDYDYPPGFDSEDCPTCGIRWCQVNSYQGLGLCSFTLGEYMGIATFVLEIHTDDWEQPNTSQKYTITTIGLAECDPPGTVPLGSETQCNDSALRERDASNDAALREREASNDW
jgi:hypothetical protein